MTAILISIAALGANVGTHLHVIDADGGQPIPGVTVELKLGNVHRVFFGTTGADGVVRPNLESNGYTVGGQGPIKELTIAASLRGYEMARPNSPINWQSPGDLENGYVTQMRRKRAVQYSTGTAPSAQGQTTYYQAPQMSYYAGGQYAAMQSSAQFGCCRPAAVPTAVYRPPTCVGTQYVAPVTVLRPSTFAYFPSTPTPYVPQEHFAPSPCAPAAAQFIGTPQTVRFSPAPPARGLSLYEQIQAYPSTFGQVRY